MALYFLEYDLRKKRDYQKLYEELNSFEAKRVLESLWCFNRVNSGVASLREHFKQFIDSDDGLIVMEVTNWATTRTQATPKDL